jgi:hypothetical protein
MVIRLKVKRNVDKVLWLLQCNEDSVCKMLLRV